MSVRVNFLRIMRLAYPKFRSKTVLFSVITVNVFFYTYCISAVIPIMFVIRMIVGIATLRLLLVNVFSFSFFNTLNKEQKPNN